MKNLQKQDDALFIRIYLFFKSERGRGISTILASPDNLSPSKMIPTDPENWIFFEHSRNISGWWWVQKSYIIRL